MNLDPSEPVCEPCMGGKRPHLDPAEPQSGRGARGPAAPGAAELADAVDWLAAYRDGDQAAFVPFVEAYQRRLVAFFFRLCWDRDRAEDLTQDLFLKLLRNATRYHPEGKLSTYVFRVATNLWIDHYRQTRPQPRFASLDQVLTHDEPGLSQSGRGSEATGPLQDAITVEERQRLRLAIEKLTAPHRLVFEFAIFQELPYGEIASILSIPVGTVKSRMHNSMHALKGLLNPAAEQPDVAPDRGAAEPRGDSTFREAPATGGAFFRKCAGAG